jgi:hypothetical protein
MVSTVQTDELAFFGSFAEDVPETVITAETDESVTPPKPVETKLTETDELVDLCDERCQEFVRSWATEGLPLPEVGYELLDEKKRVCAQAELAWAGRKVVAVLPEGIDVTDEFEKRGWTVFNATELAKVEDELKQSLGI